MKTKPFKFLKKGDVFNLPAEKDGRLYVKLGNHGAREVIEDDRVLEDKHCIPALFDQCHVTHNMAD